MSLCRLLRAPAGIRPFPALSPRIFPQMLAPIPRWSSWCIYPFLPRRHRPSSRRNRLGNSTNYPYSDFRTEWLLGAAVISLCSGLQVCSPLRSPLPQCALTATHGAAVASTSPHISVCYLPEQGDMLAARIGQLTAWGLSPHKILGLAGRSSGGATIFHPWPELHPSPSQNRTSIFLTSGSSLCHSVSLRPTIGAQVDANTRFGPTDML